MNISRPLLLVSGTLLSLVAYGLAVWAGAARNAAGLGFNERFSVGRLLGGFGKVSMHQIKNMQFEIWEGLSVVGMVIVMAAALAGMKRVSRWVPAAYLAILIVLGGWAGMVTVVFLPVFLFNLIFDPLPMDGEFFAESTARYMGAGVWLLVLLVWSLAGFIKWRPKWLKPPRARHYI